MKKNKILMIAVMASLMFVGCGSKPETPTEVVEKVYNATLKFDFKTIKKYVVEKHLDAIERSEKNNSGNMDELKKEFENVKFKIISEEISEDGKSAKVTVQVYNTNENDEPFEEEMDLVKVSGEWKIDERIW
jgi:PBP1b-binding outer membrane lipoprotein LpoB